MNAFTTAVSTQNRANVADESSMFSAVNQRDAFVYAIGCEQIAILYQPQIDFRRKTIVGMEVSVSWSRVGWGEIPQKHLIQLAREWGLMHELTSFILTQSFSEARSWPPSVRLCLDASSLNIESLEFCQLMQSTLRKCQLNAVQVELELCGGALYDSRRMGFERAEEISKLGISLSIADFGDGLANCALLSRLQFSKIKVGGGLIGNVTRDKTCREAAKAIVAIAQDLSIPALAEGIETVEQLREIIALKYAMGQGILLGKPTAQSGIAEFWER